MNKKIIKSLGQCVELSLKAGETVSYDVNFKVKINGKTWNVYNVDISYRDILLTSDQGYAEYLVDSYGDNHFAVLHDWNDKDE